MDEEMRKFLIEMTTNSSPVARGLRIVTTAVCVRCHNEVEHYEAALCQRCNGTVWQLKNRLRA